MQKKSLDCVENDSETMVILKSATAEVARRLVELAQHEDPKIAMPACKEVLDRAQGKPESVSKLQVAGNEGGTVIFRWQQNDGN